jgi:mannose-6-phosphate isomerase-like protein (cupin superfamily)
MASSVRYPDLFGIFIKVFKKKINLDLVDFASSHYLVTQGFLKCSIGKKKINLKQGDSIWMAPFVKHGFGGAGALIKISNGECISTGDIIESSKLYDIKKTLLRSYRDINTWGYN